MKKRAFSLRKEAVKGSRENLGDGVPRSKIPDQLFDALVCFIACFIITLL
jgi:hypothetical protein